LIKLAKKINLATLLFPEEKKRTISLPSLPINASLNSDWEKIGLDMWNVINKFEADESLTNQCRDENDRKEKCTRGEI
jgi:hypothetical protein